MTKYASDLYDELLSWFTKHVVLHTHLNKECFQHHIGFACLPKAPPNWIRHSAVFPLCHCYLSNCYVDSEVPQLSTKGRTKRHISRRVYSHQTADLRQDSLESSLELLRSLLDTCATWVFNQKKDSKTMEKKWSQIEYNRSFTVLAVY